MNNMLKKRIMRKTEEERVEQAYQQYRRDMQKGQYRELKCGKCGNQTTDDDRYCGSCGKALF